MWLILLLYSTSSFTIVVDSAEDCRAFVDANRAHWAATEQRPQVACMRTFEV
jgi:hypothetical protein